LQENHTTDERRLLSEGIIFLPVNGGDEPYKFDKALLFDGGSIGGLFLLVKGYFASVLHRKAGTYDAIG
jgi:hypothetical protein